MDHTFPDTPLDAVVRADIVQDFLGSLARMEDEVTNVWVRQIESGRTHSEEAIMELVARFEAIVRNLESAVDASDTGSRKGDEANLRSVLQNGEARLHGVVELLELSLGNRDLLLAEVKQLSTYIRDLESMAEAVSSLASQTNMLALNAAIEAAHAGESGRGFAVVASQVRSLSQKSSETGRRISDTIRIIGGAISGTFAKAEAYASEDSERVDAAKQDIGCVLGDFRQLAGYLEDSAEALRESTRGIKDEIAEAMVHMQFQDRVSQILSHVRDNIGKLPSYIARYEQHFNEEGELVAIDWSELMDDLMGTYATHEEFVNHDSTQLPDSRQSSPVQTLTFF
jgi:methyl-accepting chemotaxis protein